MESLTRVLRMESRSAHAEPAHAGHQRSPGRQLTSDQAPGPDVEDGPTGLP